MSDWTLHSGDCLDPATGLATIADRGVDHVLMDPPYSERVHRRLGSEGRSDGHKGRGALTFSHLTRDMARAVAEHVCRVTRRWILIFCDELSFGMWVDAIEMSGGEYVRKGCWDKTDAMPQMSGDRPSTGTEEIVIAHAPRESGRMRWNGGGKKAVYRGLAQEPGIRRWHPAQKPQWLLRALIADFTDPGELILDPFGGVASAGIAALSSGRRYIGWELDPQFHAIATARLGSPERLPSGDQLGLFGGGSGGPP